MNFLVICGSVPKNHFAKNKGSYAEIKKFWHAKAIFKVKTIMGVWFIKDIRHFFHFFKLFNFCVEQFFSVEFADSRS